MLNIRLGAHGQPCSPVVPKRTRRHLCRHEKTPYLVRSILQPQARRKGHLFENRYKSILCDEDNYLLALVRYIHLNPVRAKIIKTMAELDRYPWTGHRAIIDKAKYPWMDTATVLAQFGGTKRKAITNIGGLCRKAWIRGTIHSFPVADLCGASADGPMSSP